MDEHGKIFVQTYIEGKLLSSNPKIEPPAAATFAQFVSSVQQWFESYERNMEELEERKQQLQQLSRLLEESQAREEAFQDKLQEMQIQFLQLQKENVRLVTGGSDDCTIEELQLLERTLERSKALVSTRISIMSSRKDQAEKKTRCTICGEKEKDIIFLPCGHRTSCQNCSKKLLTCPVCQVQIVSRVVTYDL